MYRKLTTRITLAFILFFTSFAFYYSPSAEASSAIKVEIDGEVIKFDQGAMLISGRTLVPMRKIFEELDSYVDWNAKTKTITATRGQKKIVLTIGSKTATVNGQKITLDVAPQVINSRTLVPLRFISEALGAKVDWNSQTKTVSIVTFEYLERYYYVDIQSLNITEVINEDRYYEDFYKAHYTRELISDEIITSLLDNVRYFESEHTGYVSNAGTYDALMTLDGVVINGKASGDYIIDLYDIYNGRLVRTYTGTFTDIPYNRNIKMTIQEVLNKNHAINQ